jgi:hypothetical protein
VADHAEIAPGDDLEIETPLGFQQRLHAGGVIAHAGERDDLADPAGQLEAVVLPDAQAGAGAGEGDAGLAFAGRSGGGGERAPIEDDLQIYMVTFPAEQVIHIAGAALVTARRTAAFHRSAP